tara:strand:+ start:157 stop:384 length:228 start_codon:yes stop_codon:yes gene_type:complete
MSNSGTWIFQNGDKNKMLRSDGVAMSISVTATILRTSFTTSGGLKDGNWVFDFVKQKIIQRFFFFNTHSIIGVDL